MNKRRVTLFLTFIVVITLFLVSFTVYITSPKQTICIDAGHGGSEKGAIGCLGDKEKDINFLLIFVKNYRFFFIIVV